VVDDADTDDQRLSDFFQAASPLIEELVTRALQQGGRVKGLVVLLERKRDGQVAGGCGGRGVVEARLRDIEGADDIARQMILRRVGEAMATEVPVVLLVHGEGFISVGVKRVKGKVGLLS